MRQNFIEWKPGSFLFEFGIDVQEADFTAEVSCPSFSPAQNCKYFFISWHPTRDALFFLIQFQFSLQWYIFTGYIHE